MRQWTAARKSAIHGVNVKAEAAVKASLLQQHPEAADRMNFLMPKSILYASKRGDGNPQRLMIPLIRIQALPSRASSLSLEVFLNTADNMAVASNAKLLGPATSFEVKGHGFMRVDFERSAGGMRIYQGYVQTLAEDCLLTIEIYATSAGELRNIASALQMMVIAGEQ